MSIAFMRCSRGLRSSVWRRRVLSVSSIRQVTSASLSQTRVATSTPNPPKPEPLTPNPTRPSIPTTQTCPTPTCPCASTPPDLDIDRKTPLLNTMAAYAEHVVFCTGKSDWNSNIEQEEGATGDFVKGVKGVIGKGGEGFDPFNNVLLSASSLPPNDALPNTTLALLFPAFVRIPFIRHEQSAFRAFASSYLKARKLHPMHDALSETQKSALLRDDTHSLLLPPALPIRFPVILICGHGARDSRCGILGPILQSAFEKELAKRGVHADVAQISHVGGHKFAGNVIVYTPPTWGNELAGTGVWYGRVGPEHVEGLVEETVVRGRIVLGMLRGGIMGDGGSLGRVVEAQAAKENGEEGLRLKPRARG